MFKEARALSLCNVCSNYDNFCAYMAKKYPKSDFADVIDFQSKLELKMNELSTLSGMPISVSTDYYLKLVLLIDTSERQYQPASIKPNDEFEQYSAIGVEFKRHPTDEHLMSLREHGREETRPCSLNDMMI